MAQADLVDIGRGSEIIGHDAVGDDAETILVNSFALRRKLRDRRAVRHDAVDEPVAALLNKQVTALAPVGQLAPTGHDDGNPRLARRPIGEPVETEQKGVQNIGRMRPKIAEKVAAQA